EMDLRDKFENPYKKLKTTQAKIKKYLAPDNYGVKRGKVCYTNYTIPPYYDSMVAKLIIHEPTRDEAIMAGIRALSEFVVLGIDTTIPFHIKLLNNDIFRSGKFVSFNSAKWPVMPSTSEVAILAITDSTSGAISTLPN
ncbi:hypothetical protein HGQ77_15690, partial [Staphylococcus aureus]|nr:hypothetical protein [Staphylococcus aureus]